MICDAVAANGMVDLWQVKAVLFSNEKRFFMAPTKGVGQVLDFVPSSKYDDYYRGLLAGSGSTFDKVDD